MRFIYHLSALPRIAPWLFRYWQNAAPERSERSARALAPLMARCVDEHEVLIADAGAARALVRQNGWIRCLRTEGTLREIAEARRLDQYGIDYAVLTGAQLRELEPHVSEKIIGAIHFRASPTSSDPGALTKAYVDLFLRKGGLFLKGDARRLAQNTSGWSISAENGPITAPKAVVALGPWSDDVFRPLGYDIPLAVKRGYHMHYGVHGNARLGHPLHDADGGYLLVPMSKGIRLTTGVEFAERDAPPTPVQLTRDEPLARELFPLGERLEPAPWMGRRPCLPDMVPVIGRDRARGAPPRSVVRLRPRPSWLHARTRHRQAARRNDDRGDALYRSDALRGQPIRKLNPADEPQERCVADWRDRAPVCSTGRERTTPHAHPWHPRDD
jgi:D-amino-acid dehydrogenase